MLHLSNLKYDSIIFYFIVENYYTFRDKFSKDLEHILTPLESERYNRYLKIKDKMNFLIGRYIVKKTLRYYKKDFEYSLNKKPYIPKSWKFNISHTENFIAVAFSKKYEVGVDVELKASIPISELLDYFASPEERIRIINKSGFSQLEEFYRIWTTKEAILKSSGLGLIDNLNSLNTCEIIKSFKGSYFEKIIQDMFFIACFTESENTLIETKLLELDDSFFEYDADEEREEFEL